MAQARTALQRPARRHVADHGLPRIDLHSVAKVNVDGISVEPLIHACAELFDNATRYSPPHTRVHVTAHEVQTGVAIEIEDAGISLNDVVRERVERKLEEAKAGIDVDDLGETPRLGLAVVGRLARMYDMQIALRQSAYGGVRAVLIVPRDMLTDEPAPAVAHGIGAAAVQRIDDDGNLIADERPYRRRHPPPARRCTPPARCPRRPRTTCPSSPSGPPRACRSGAAACAAASRTPSRRPHPPPTTGGRRHPRPRRRRRSPSPASGWRPSRRQPTVWTSTPVPPPGKAASPPTDTRTTKGTGRDPATCQL
ncbi:sensor histidine kinase [Actinomadura keratinilytica]